LSWLEFIGSLSGMMIRGVVISLYYHD
jgi:hypothetical protein